MLVYHKMKMLTMKNVKRGEIFMNMRETKRKPHAKSNTLSIKIPSILPALTVVKIIF